MRHFGLIGFPLSHSFSRQYFREKFEKEGILDAQYENLPLENILDFPALIKRFPNLRGLNVTIPHKQAVMPFLDEIEASAQVIGAVNTIRVEPEGRLTGFNTDAYGFERSLLEWLPANFKGQALVLGTGGASKAICFVLTKNEIQYKLVSRSPGEGQLGYEDIDKELLEKYKLIVNTTPLGTHPNIESCPDIPYDLLGPNHYLYDLVYNPSETKFMRLGAASGAQTHNGLQMLILQAEGAWQIWNRL
ncbi:MAG: shikimate dehydrogenase [Bacteroidetes bacterium]|nr:shikimate dehydrogenase [Bacteroidota bacterium]